MFWASLASRAVKIGSAAKSFWQEHWPWIVGTIVLALAIWFAQAWISRTIAAIETNAATAERNILQPQIDALKLQVQAANANVTAAQAKAAQDAAALIEQRDQVQRQADKNAAAVAAIRKQLKERPQDGGEVPVILFDTLQQLR